MEAVSLRGIGFGRGRVPLPVQRGNQIAIRDRGPIGPFPASAAGIGLRDLALVAHAVEQGAPAIVD